MGKNWINDLMNAVSQSITTPELEGHSWVEDDGSVHWIEMWPALMNLEGHAEPVYDAQMEFDLDGIREIADTVSDFTSTQEKITLGGTYQGHEFVLDILFSPPAPEPDPAHEDSKRKGNVLRLVK